MKIFSPTPTTRTSRTKAFPSRAMFFLARLQALFQFYAGGYSFGVFAPVGVIQLKEVVIEEKGHHFLCSKSHSNFFNKEF